MKRMIETPVDTLPGDPLEAYFNPDFMNSPTARPLRILAEYLQPKERFEQREINDTILFFGSARILPADVAQARLDAAQADGGEDAVKLAQRAVRMSRYY